MFTIKKKFQAYETSCPKNVQRNDKNWQEIFDSFNPDKCSTEQNNFSYLKIFEKSWYQAKIELLNEERTSYLEKILISQV